MAQLHIHLLGEFSARDADGTSVGFRSKKEEELFCYLLVNRGRPCPREIIANLLWGESETARSKKYLRTALWHLRADLGFTSGAPLLETSVAFIQLQRGVNIWADIDPIEDAFALVQRSSDHDLTREQVTTILETIALYRGEFLEGWYQEWCLYERERFQQMYFRLIDRMMEVCETRREFHNALELGMRLLRLEPARECTHRRMMRLYDMAGDRYSAIRQFERCVASLREELGVSPSRITLEQYEHIRTARAERPNPPGADAPPAMSLSLPKLLGHLSEIRAVLESIERQITLEIDRRSGAPAKIPSD